jgi:hypothetical protein
MQDVQGRNYSWMACQARLSHAARRQPVHTMIRPKTRRPSKADEKTAYKLATLRDGGMCVRCGRTGDTTRDHRKNRSVGGLTVASNLQLLCGSGTTGCHGWKTVRPDLAIGFGFAVPGWANPELWPAWHLGEWVLYDDLGGWTGLSKTEADRLLWGHWMTLDEAKLIAHIEAKADHPNLLIHAALTGLVTAIKRGDFSHINLSGKEKGVKNDDTPVV